MRPAPVSQDASLELARVIEPLASGAFAAPVHNVFGWWFPPKHPKLE